MDFSYIAGSFDGEGSAMALTVKCNISGKTMFRIRPVLKIAQGKQEILEQIRQFIGYGNVVSATKGCFALQINSNKNIIEFANTIGELLIIKKQQVMILKSLAEYQDINFSNNPYTREAMEHMLNLRDEVFKANTWTRARIMQKYSKQDILAQHCFVDIKKWQDEREAHRKKALKQYQVKS